MTDLKKRRDTKLVGAVRPGRAMEGQASPVVKLVRRAASRTVTQTASVGIVAAKALTVSGKMVLQTSKLKPFRGFTQTPEEGQQLSRTSFTDTPLLRRIAKK